MKTLSRTWGGVLIILILILFTPVYSDEQTNSLILQQITSDDEMNRYQANQTNQYNGAYSGAGTEYFTNDMVSGRAALPDLGEMKAAAPARQESVQSNPVSDNKGGANGYTTTNNQVSGVDEADFVKNDGKYIYIVNGNTRHRPLQSYHKSPYPVRYLTSSLPVTGWWSSPGDTIIRIT